MLQPSPTQTNRKVLLAVIGLVAVFAGYTLTRGADSKTPAVGAAAQDFTLLLRMARPLICTTLRASGSSFTFTRRISPAAAPPKRTISNATWRSIKRKMR